MKSAVNSDSCVIMTCLDHHDPDHHDPGWMIQVKLKKMVKRWQHWTIAAAMVFVWGGWDWLSTADKNVAAGNDAYQVGAFAKALEAYDRFQSEHGVSAAIDFDRGTALYKLATNASDDVQRAALLEQAESAFRRATDTTDARLISAAYHNLGNTHFLRKRWPQAIEAYRKALRANQDNDSARYNLELALKRAEQKKPNSSSGQPGQPNSSSGQSNSKMPQHPEPQVDRDRKLDRLEERSRRLRRQRLRGIGRRGQRRLDSQKDW